ncbi:MAG: DUF21 domain-containing protein [Planctomycetales bacterium]|nr:DUF21 domain-containing protein [Planctomycetales bacterium]
MPLGIAMAVLVGVSAFFSASEAALFSLRATDRSIMRGGTASQRRAHALLEDPDRLLSAVLFWNLFVNIAYFSLASRVGLKLQAELTAGTTAAAAFTMGALIVLIFCSEMLPKSVAVLKARQLSAWVSYPLSLAVRCVDPVMPGLRVVNLLSRRLVWPTFEPEPYLQVNDLERAIELSTQDSQLVDQERHVLRNLVALSDMTVDEAMRPRSQLVMLRPPITWSDVLEEDAASEWVFVTELDNDEIVAAIDLSQLVEIPERHFEYLATPVMYAPWCAKVADVLQEMESRGYNAAAVVNELGETIGAVMRSDLLDMIFRAAASRSERLLKREPVMSLGDGLWQATGMSNLRALEQHFNIELPETPSVTLAGAVQECLQRLPQPGDKIAWGPLLLEIMETPRDEPALIQIQLREIPEDTT